MTKTDNTPTAPNVKNILITHFASHAGGIMSKVKKEQKGLTHQSYRYLQKALLDFGVRFTVFVTNI